MNKVLAGLSILLLSASICMAGCKCPMEKRMGIIDEEVGERYAKEYLEVTEKLRKGEITTEEAAKRIDEITKEVADDMGLKKRE